MKSCMLLPLAFIFKYINAYCPHDCDSISCNVTALLLMVSKFSKTHSTTSDALYQFNGNP